jgi:phosphoribosylamine-glycine ligase
MTILSDRQLAELKLGHCASVEHVFVYPGTGGTEGHTPYVSNIKETELDFPSLAALAKGLAIGLVVVGPDDAVVGGIDSHFRQRELNGSSSSAFSDACVQREYLVLLPHKKLPR